MTDAAPKRFRPSASAVFFVLFAAAVVLAGISIGLGLQHEEALRQEIVRSYATRSDIQAVLSQLEDAETRQRGYLLTDDKRLLQSYNQSLEAIIRQRTILALSIDGDSTQRADFHQLGQAIDAKLAEMAKTLSVNEQNGLAAAQARIRQGSGLTEMSAIRSAIARLDTREQARLLSRRGSAARFRVQRNVIMLGLVALIGIAMGVILWGDERRRSTQTKTARDLDEASARLRAIFDSALDTIITLNPSGSIETINAAGVALFGYGQAELIRRDISLLLDMAPDAKGAFIARLQGPRDLGKGFVRELKARTKDGREIPVDVALSTMTLPDGPHVVAVVRDASERRAVEALKDGFIATVSHELRTPLTSIAGSLGLLRGGAGGQLPPRALRLVEIAESNGARLVRLINDILDIEKIQSGTAVFDRQPLQLRELARLACEAMSGLAFERGVDLHVQDIEADLWMVGDHDRMMQVLTNLISNAIKVSPKQARVGIAAEVRNAHARLMVVDQGPGVPENFRDRIFSPFAQANATDGRDLGGTGLGLSIVREIVERHGGVVGYESTPGQGATFYVEVPRVDPPAGDVQAEVDGAPRILICEDDDLVAELIADWVEDLGYEADRVATANEARHALHTGGYAVMLLDIRLPDSDGVTLMQSLRAQPNTADLPIIAMSGSREHQERARELGIVDWLEKPIRMERLKDALQEGLRTRSKDALLILHVDDDRDLSEVARARLGGLGEVVGASSLAAARAILARRRPDLVILDLGLPDGSGEALLDDLRALESGAPPTILYTAQDPSTAPGAPVEAVLIKSRSDLANLTRTARRLLEGERP